MSETAEPVDFSRLSRHEPGKVALLFWGGKDSRALIELFRPYLDGIAVYHNDTGDLWPERREFVAKVAETSRIFGGSRPTSEPPYSIPRARRRRFSAV